MAERIWEYDVLDEYELEGLTESSLKKAEYFLGVKLPNSYIELMQNQNGGRLFRTLIKLDQIGKDVIHVDYLLGIGRKKNEGILKTIYMRKEWELPNDIVLIGGDNHAWIALDYRQKQPEPSISFIDLEEKIDIQLAIDFEEFITKLLRDNETNRYELVAEGSYTPAQLEKEVEKGDDLFLVTDSFLYFSVADCDIDWLIGQAIIVMDNPDEFMAPEVMAFTMKKIASAKQETLEKDSLIVLAKKIENHKSVHVRKYYKKILNYIK